MLYTLLCYNDETMTSAWSEAEDAEVMERLDGVHRKWAANMKPVVRLMPTSAATTYRKAEKLITDGPYAETKEQLLGIGRVSCSERVCQYVYFFKQKTAYEIE